jgi:hypothetical protein
MSGRIMIAGFGVFFAAMALVADARGNDPRGPQTSDSQTEVNIQPAARLRLGMSQEQVEKLLGEYRGFGFCLGFYDGHHTVIYPRTGLVIHFDRDNRVQHVSPLPAPVPAAPLEESRLPAGTR